MDRIGSETFRLGSPDFADVFVRREPLETLGKIVGQNKVIEVAAKLSVVVVKEALHGRVLDGPVHALDLPVRPRMLGLGKPVVYVVLCASQDEGMGAEPLIVQDHFLDFSGVPTLPAGVGKVNTVIGQNSVNRVRHGLDQGAQEIGGDPSGGFSIQLREGELACSVYGHE
jgi:hypothetical protein